MRTLSVVPLLAMAAGLTAPGATLPIVPRPVSAQELPGRFKLSKSTVITADPDARPIAMQFRDQLQKEFGVSAKFSLKPARKNGIAFVLDNAMPEESYKLKVTPGAITITGGPAGLFYGTQSLMQLIPAGKAPFRVPAVEVQDQPRFAYRGVHLDTGRHFFPVDFVKRYIDLAARFKLNRFHWHLTDDQGWRLEIKKYPRLTEVGSRRKETVVGHAGRSSTYDGKPYGGYYTQDEARDVVAYAAARFVTVLPEIEMPGHATAALAAYPQYACTAGPFEVATTWGVFKDIFCPKEETFSFLEDVLTEVISLFPSQYIHVGGDECPKDRWRESAIAQEVMKREGLKDENELQSYFIRRIEKFINSKGRRLIGWDEILEGGLAPDATVMSWRGEKGGIEAAKQHHNVVMTPTTYVYLDYYQGPPDKEPLAIGGNLPLEKVYSYNPLPAELSPEDHHYIQGVQANVWTEYMPEPSSVEYMVFPRLLAVAEIAWTPQENREYAEFLTRVPAQLGRLKKDGVNFRPLDAR